MILDENHSHALESHPGPFRTHHLLRPRLLKEMIGSPRLPTLGLI